MPEEMYIPFTKVRELSKTGRILMSNHPASIGVSESYDRQNPRRYR